MQSHTLCSVPVTSDMLVFFGQMMDLFNSRGMTYHACPFQFACTIWGQLASVLRLPCPLWWDVSWVSFGLSEFLSVG